AVVPASVHHAVVARAVRERVRLLDRQRVHVGAQPDAPWRFTVLQDTHYACLADSPMHLDAERLEPRRHQVRSSFLVEAELRMRVNIAPPLAHLLLVLKKGGEMKAIQDGV